jgi:hypothetical protein
MRLIEIRKLEDCFDGSIIFKYSFDREVDEVLMKRIGEEGKVQYFPEFARPFFKIITPGSIQVRGIVGDRDFEAVYPQTDKWVKKGAFEANLKKLLEEIV